MPETLEEALKEIAELKAKNDDITRNFEGFRTISKEKEKFLTKELETTKEELSTSLDSTKAEYESYKKDVEGKEYARRTAFMDKRIADMSKGDAKIAEQLKAEYALLNLPEDSEEAISARLEKARGFINPKAPGVEAAAGA